MTMPSQVLSQVKAIAALSAGEQAAALVRIALTAGLARAVQISRFLNNPYVLRAFYNELVSVHYQELMDAGKIIPL